LFDHLGGDTIGGGAGQILFLGVAVTVFGPAEDAEAVALVVFKLRVRIMGQTDPVDAKVGHEGIIGKKIVIGHRRGLGLNLLMQVGTGENDGFAVQEGTAGGGFKHEVAKTGGLNDGIDDLKAAQNLDFHVIQIRRGGGPELGIGDGAAELDGHPLTGGDDGVLRVGLHGGVIGIEQGGADGGILQVGQIIAHEDLDGKVGVVIGNQFGRDVNAQGGVVGGINVQGGGGDEPDLAIESAPNGVEPAVAGQTVGVIGRVIVHTDGEIVVAWMQGGRGVEDEPGVAAAMLAEMFAIYVNISNGRSAFEH